MIHETNPSTCHQIAPIPRSVASFVAGHSDRGSLSAARDSATWMRRSAVGIAERSAAAGLQQERRRGAGPAPASVCSPRRAVPVDQTWIGVRRPRIMRITILLPQLHPLAKQIMRSPFLERSRGTLTQTTSGGHHHSVRELRRVHTRAGSEGPDRWRDRVPSPYQHQRWSSLSDSPPCVPIGASRAVRAHAFRVR